MLGGAFFDDVVAGVFFGVAGVAGNDILNAVDDFEDGLGAPEAAPGENDGAFAGGGLEIDRRIGKVRRKCCGEEEGKCRQGSSHRRHRYYRPQYNNGLPCDWAVRQSDVHHSRTFF